MPHVSREKLITSTRKELLIALVKIKEERANLG
jgi:hypothetical protein